MKSIIHAAAKYALAQSLSWVLLTATVIWQSSATRAEQPLDFSRNVRPILADACFACHGPDQEKRQADLRFDVKKGAFIDLNGHRAIVPGDSSASEMYRRIVHPEIDQRMPPVDTIRKLTDREIEVIRMWIEQGANWDEHWSFAPPLRPPLPTPHGADRSRNPIDRFVLDRLQREGLAPSPIADATTLLRRVTLDLTGLSPTLAEIGAFNKDSSPDAYNRLVDRLLASPRFGERMASSWLDAARYADTSGYQNDGPRYMWRWRDWVIDALNRNLPFDQFTVEQLAGDLLSSPTLDQVIATGFNRNHRGNAEGGIIPEEYAVEYVVDRVETTSTVWLGLTVGCARCHDHKFDPIGQKEFYQLFAYFNRVPEHGRAIKEGNSPPMIKAPTDQQRERLRQLDARLAEAEDQVKQLAEDVAREQSEWETKCRLSLRERTSVRGANDDNTGIPPSVDWVPKEGLLAYYPLDVDRVESLNNLFAVGLVEGGPDLARWMLAKVAGEKASSIFATFKDGEPGFERGFRGEAVAFNGRRFIDCGDVADFGYFDKFSFAAWVYADRSDAGTILSRMVDTQQAEGFSVTIQNGRIHVNLVKRWLDDAIRVSTRSSVLTSRWQQVTVTYDGSRVASGIKVYLDGMPRQLDIHLDGLNQSFNTKEPLRIGAGGGADSRFRGAIDDLRIYRRNLSDDEARMVSSRATIAEIFAIPADERSIVESNKLRACFLNDDAPQHLRAAYSELGSARRDRASFFESIPTVMVMADMPIPRDTFVLTRGQYDKPGEKVLPGLPASLIGSAINVPENRLGLAKWLVDPANPLTARVAVNRLWQMLFGVGLVNTPEDFGVQGERPSHPELLDWLATELVRTGWDVKGMLRIFVTSATYQQSSRVTPERLRRDPDNRLLARGPRVRLNAETIRDQALAASGLFVNRLGGPSVKPYQPDGLWKEIATDMDYGQGHGADLYRRSLYTYWKRTVAPPTMMTFDAATRESCVVRKSQTNTPLQALALMNDVTFVECSRVLARRAMIEGGLTPEDRVSLAFRLVTARSPAPAELSILMTGFRAYLNRFQTEPKAARELCRAGEFPVDERLDEIHWAAHTMTCSVILNLDEAITKD